MPVGGFTYVFFFIFLICGLIVGVYRPDSQKIIVSAIVTVISYLMGDLNYALMFIIGVITGTLVRQDLSSPNKKTPEDQLIRI